MWLFHSLDITGLSFKGNIFMAAFFWVVGGIIVALALRLFRKANTTVNPVQPEKTTALVTTGIYRFTRNPMYLGILCVLIGVFFYFGTWLNILGLLFFVWYMTQFQIRREEKILSKIYGEAYVAYCKKTRRWL